MSGRITIDNLSDSLKEMIENSGMTEEQVKELLENKEVIDSLKTDSKSIVGAINELFQNANNGKELIASAIGEPLDASDTFSAMSNDINGLLSTFKTNMMKNGVTIESGDKFKTLIDKIATLADSEGKGIQYAEGLIANTYTINTSQAGSSNTIKLNLNGLTFKPVYLFLEMSNIRSDYIDDNMDNHPYTILSNIYTFPFYMNAFGDMSVTITSFSEKDCDVRIIVDNARHNLYATFGAWYAIGVGEEDTTLRDSLANILGDKGVEVSPDDDMASLIGKVDSIQTGGGLDIISATELPANGRENQICVITDNPTDKISINMNNNSTTDGTINVLLKESGKNIVLTNGNMTTTLPIASTSQNGSSLDSYIYKNGSWIEFIKGVYYWYTQSDKTFKHTDLFGKIEEYYSGGAQFMIESDGRIRVRAISTEMRVDQMTSVSVDMSKYSKIEMDITDYNGSGQIGIGLYADTGGTDWSYVSGNGTHTFDLSNINKTGKLRFYAYSSSSEVSCYVTEIRIYK